VQQITGKARLFFRCLLHIPYYVPYFFNPIFTAMQPLFRAKPVVLSVLSVLAFVVVGALMFRVALRSNFSAEYRMSTGISNFHENVETAITTVNQHQSSQMNAAVMLDLDARVLGAVIAARRVLYHRPLVDDAAEHVGMAKRIGIAQITVHSTEAALRILFAPSAEERLLYAFHALADTVITNSALQAYFTQYRSLDVSQFRSLLCRDAEFNIFAAALILKQAMTRYENETGVRVPHNASVAAQLFDEANTVLGGGMFVENSPATAESGTIAALLYTRSDVLP
jgi:hypothetical protein